MPQTPARRAASAAAATAASSRNSPDTRIQVNVKLPPELRDRVDQRRGALGLSRDEWTRRALTYVLDHTDGRPLVITGRRTIGRQPPF